MKVFHASAHLASPVDPRNFTGAATVARIDGLVEKPAVNMYRVTFQPAARTAWHAHTGVQLLLVIEGRCRLQKEGEPIQEVAAGGAIRIEPGERHWHGAAPDTAMTHLALNIDAATEWFEKVTDAHYAGSPSQHLP
jgi:quercetin dioxygenase-like cupin family protein